MRLVGWGWLTLLWDTKFTYLIPANFRCRLTAPWAAERIFFGSSRIFFILFWRAIAACFLILLIRGVISTHSLSLCIITLLIIIHSITIKHTKEREAFIAPRPNLPIIPGRPTLLVLALASLSSVRRPFRIWRSWFLFLGRSLPRNELWPPQWGWDWHLFPQGRLWIWGWHGNSPARPSGRCGLWLAALPIPCPGWSRLLGYLFC